MSVLAITDCQVGLDKLFAFFHEDTVASSTQNHDRPMCKLTARKLHQDNLETFRAMKKPGDPQNDTLNACAFFAARAFAAGVFDETEEQIKTELLKIAKSTRYCPGAKSTLSSGWRGGIAKGPLLIKEEQWPDITETIEEFNKDYFTAFVSNKEKVCKLVETVDPRNGWKRKNLLLYQPADFTSHNRSYMIQVGEKIVQGTVVPQMKNRGEVWLNHPLHERYHQVIFKPLGPATVREGDYNLWKGFAVTPAKGDCSKYLSHLLENVCVKDLVKYNYLIGWMAYAVRNPNEQGYVCIAITGRKGVGKNVAAEGFGALWGQHATVLTGEHLVMSNFNAHLRDLCVMIADEAFFAKDPKHEEILKGYTTGHSLHIEGKGLDVVEVNNLLHIILLGNNKHLVPATHDERRYFVLECGEAHREDFDYFEAINQELKNGGYAALLYHLMYEVDLRNFNVRKAPHTNELHRQIIESLKDADKAVYQCAYGGHLPGRPQADGTVRLKLNDLASWLNKPDQRQWGSVNIQQLQVVLGKKGLGLEPGDPKKDSKQKDLPGMSGKSRWWVIPDLKRFREMWEARYTKGAKVEWPDDGDKWETAENWMPKR